MPINVTVRGKIAALAQPCAYLVCDNSGYVIHFDFDAEWDAAATKTARFKSYASYTDVIFSGADCPAPQISEPGYVEVGVYAGELMTTTPAYIPVTRSILTGGGTPADPTPSVYEQLLALLDAKAAIDQGVENAGKYWRVAQDGSLELAPGGGGGGTTDHRDLDNRDAANQHPMSAITGLVAALAAKQAAMTADVDYATPGYVTGRGYITAADIPVLSVNGKTGTVVLTAADLGIGSVFELKGSKATAAQLPSTGNRTGDVWYVVDESVGYIWLNDGETDRWEKLGMTVDLSAYRTASAQDTIDAGKQPKAISTPEGLEFATTVEAALEELAATRWTEADMKSWAFGSFQLLSIEDAGGYFTTDTVNGALQEIGAELAGINTLLGSGVIA